LRRKKGSTLQARKGLPGGAYRPLTEEDIAQIHATSMKVFEEVGIQINSERALSLFKDAGASVETENRIVRMPAQKGYGNYREHPPCGKVIWQEQ